MITGQQLLRNCSKSLLPNAEFTAHIVNEILTALPNRYRFSSGCRTVKENSAAGGVSNSYHLTGYAGDLVSFSGNYPTNEKAIIQNILNKYNYEMLIHNVGSGLHLHIEPKSKPVNNTIIPSKPVIKESTGHQIIELPKDEKDNKTIYYVLGFLAILALR